MPFRKLRYRPKLSCSENSFLTGIPVTSSAKTWSTFDTTDRQKHQSNVEIESKKIRKRTAARTNAKVSFLIGLNNFGNSIPILDLSEKNVFFITCWITTFLKKNFFLWVSYATVSLCSLKRSSLTWNMNRPEVRSIATLSFMEDLAVASTAPPSPKCAWTIGRAVEIRAPRACETLCSI